MLRLFIVLIIGVACSSKKVEKKSRLFPYGTYQQKVSMTKDGKQLAFPARTEWTRGLFSLEVVDPEKKVLVKYDEDLRAYKKKVFIDHQRVPLTEEKAIFYFSYLKFIYSLDRSICKDALCEYSFMGQDFSFDLDRDERVKRIRMKRGERMMDVDVLDYQPVDSD